MKSIKYRGEELTIQTSVYHNGPMAVSLMSKDGPYCRLSVNLDDAAMARLPKGCFYLKDWSENAPIARFLLDNHILFRVRHDGQPILDEDETGLIALTADSWADAVRFAGTGGCEFCGAHDHTWPTT